MKLEVGDQVPSVLLKDQKKQDFNTDHFKGKKPFVIYFYPKNFTSQCTKEACSFRDSYEEFKDLGAEVIGISSDSEESHAEFVEKYRLPFIFLSDKEKVARKEFAVKTLLFGMIPGRESFVFDKKGILRNRFNNIFGTPHVDNALRIMREIMEKEN